MGAPSIVFLAGDFRGEQADLNRTFNASRAEFMGALLGHHVGRDFEVTFLPAPSELSSPGNCDQGV